MAYVQPSTNIVLIKNCILQKSDNNETDTLYFASREAQTNYFDAIPAIGSENPSVSYGSTRKITYSPTTYQNMGQGVMRIGKTMKELYGCNYMYFTNSDSYKDANNQDVSTPFEGKRYYCFIDGLKYINNNCTEVYYSIDYIQTFMFDYTEKTCLVERMTPEHDYVGEYLLDEGLDLGSQYIVDKIQHKFFSSWLYLVTYGSVHNLPVNTIRLSSSDTKSDRYGVCIGRKAVPGTSAIQYMAKYFFELKYKTTSYLMNGVIPMQLIVVNSVNVYSVITLDGLVIDGRPTGNFTAVVNPTYVNFDFTSDVSKAMPDGDGTKTGKEIFNMLYCTNTVVDVFSYSNSDKALNDSDALLSNIVNVMIFPSELNSINSITEQSDGKYYLEGRAEIDIIKPKKYIAETINNITVYKYGMNSFGSYPPKNNKLFTFPYVYFIVSTTDGNSQTYRFEQFSSSISSDKATFNLIGCGLPSPIMCMYPTDYGGTDTTSIGNVYDESGTRDESFKNLEMGVTITNFPMFALKVDEYKKYLDKNRYRDNLDTVDAILSLGTTIGTGLVAPSVTTGFSLAKGVVHTVKEYQSIAKRVQLAKQVPDSFIGQIGTSDLNVAAGQCGFRVTTMRIDTEHARTIDDYFTRYGYKIAHHVDLSGKRNVRKYFTYIKTIECNLSISSSMCQEDEKAIETIYNNGVRFWTGAPKNGERYYKNYSLDNSTDDYDIPVESTSNDNLVGGDT